MGLDVSHNCWSGPYSAFHRFRLALAEAAGIPLPFMEGFFDPGAWPHDYLRQRVAAGPLLISSKFEEVRRFFPMSWKPFESDPVTHLLCHSDCDGVLELEVLTPLAARLEELAPRLAPEPHERALQWIKGLRDAAERGEVVEFR